MSDIHPTGSYVMVRRHPDSIGNPFWLLRWEAEVMDEYESGKSYRTGIRETAFTRRAAVRRAERKARVRQNPPQWETA